MPDAKNPKNVVREIYKITKPVLPKFYMLAGLQVSIPNLVYVFSFAWLFLKIAILETAYFVDIWDNIS